MLSDKASNAFFLISGACGVSCIVLLLLGFDVAALVAIILMLPTMVAANLIAQRHWS